MLKLMLVDDEGNTIIITEAAEEFNLDKPMAQFALVREVKDAIKTLQYVEYKNKEGE